jgi:hypothetical protein
VRQQIATWNPARGAWEVPATESLLCEHLEVFSQTWPSSGMTRRGTAYAPPTSAHLTAGSASSSSPGPLMATPDASVFNDGQTLEAWQKRHERERAKGYNGNGGGTPLAMQVQMLPTPQARDTTNGGPNQRGSSGDLMLPSAVQLLPTPSVADALGGHRSRSGDRSGELAAAGTGATDWGAYEPAVRRWGTVLGRPAPAPTEVSRNGGQRLSPRFVEWMMGLDDGWVTAVPGLTRNDQLKALGNGVVPQQAAAALSTLLAWRAAAIGEVTRSA